MATAHIAGSATGAPDHSRFSNPLDVVRAAGIRDEEKLRLLLDWLEDEVALLVADDEGMFGGAASLVDGVLAALRALDQANEVWRRSPWPAM